MATYSRTKFVRAALQLLSRYPRQQVVRVLAQEIVAQRRGRDLDTILLELGRELWRTKRHAELNVVSAHPLPANKLAALKRQFKQYLQAETVAVTAAVDRSLTGGITVATPTGSLDASAKRLLTRLKQL